MYKGKKNLAIIPARGGSKGLPDKNIRILCGKPLIGWTIEQAKESKYIDEIFISTDSQKIADIAEDFGIRVPELRPSEIATDIAPSSAFVLHTINLYRRIGVEFDYVLLLEPTSPLRKRGDIDHAISLLSEDNTCIGVVSLGEVHMEHPLIVKKIIDDKPHPYVLPAETIIQRQMLDKAYFPYGVVYLVNRAYFEKEQKFYSELSLPYYIERWQNYEVDDIYDFLCVESILEYKKEEIL